MRYSTAGKILVVDEELQNVEVFRRLMTRLGYEVLTASDGESGLQRVMSGRPERPYKPALSSEHAIRELGVKRLEAGSLAP